MKRINNGVICDAAEAQVAMYKGAGLLSARLGKSFLGKLKEFDNDFSFYPIFASVNELIIVEDEYERKNSPKT